MPDVLPRSPRPPRAWLLITSLVIVAVVLLAAIFVQNLDRTTAVPVLPPVSESARPTTPPTTPPTTRRQPAPDPTGTATIASVPSQGPNTYHVATLSIGPTSTRGRLVKVAVAVEVGLPLEADDVARQVMATLSDGRSWGAEGKVRFQLIGTRRGADLIVFLTTPTTTDRLCAPLNTNGELSCQRDKRVILNAGRWVFGSAGYGSDLTGYRNYLVNHEVGHFLGHGHVTCPRPGAPAPVMMQQTKSLGGCRPNPWPFS